MNQTTLTFKSFTDAMRARRTLNAAGISASVAKLSSPTENGCAYAITLSGAYLSAIHILRTNGIDYRLYTE